MHMGRDADVVATDNATNQKRTLQGVLFFILVRRWSAVAACDALPTKRALNALHLPSARMPKMTQKADSAPRSGKNCSFFTGGESDNGNGRNPLVYGIQALFYVKLMRDSGVLVRGGTCNFSRKNDIVIVLFSMEK